MSGENKTIELKDKDLENVNGGDAGDYHFPNGLDEIDCDNFNETICNSNTNCKNRGKSLLQGAQYSCCINCGQNQQQFR